MPGCIYVRPRVIRQGEHKNIRTVPLLNSVVWFDLDRRNCKGERSLDAQVIG